MSNVKVMITAIKDVTEKGHQTIQCSVSKGAFANSKPTYVLSTPVAIKEFKLEVGMDISAMCEGMKHVTSKGIDTATGEVLEFNWMEVV